MGAEGCFNCFPYSHDRTLHWSTAQITPTSSTRSVHPADPLHELFLISEASCRAISVREDTAPGSHFRALRLPGLAFYARTRKLMRRMWRMQRRDPMTGNSGGKSALKR